MRKLKIVIAVAGGLFFANAVHSQSDAAAIDSNILRQLDNLMDSWYAKTAEYHHNSQAPFGDGGYENANEDSVIIHRLRLLTDQTFFPMVYNDEIRNYIRLYIRKTKHVSIVLGLAKQYFPMFEEALDKYDCPLELKYLAVIESALNPLAVSRAGATGLWQFMYNTGKIYGLEVTTLVDHRRDPLRATDAAARHLKDLSELFNGDWLLAIAAYNCGQGNVKKAIVRSGGKTNFWDIYNYLPKETRGYIPAFYGAWFAMQYYDKYGIEPAEIKFSLTDTVYVDKTIHLQQIASVLGLPIDELRVLNPQYKRDIIAGSATPLELTLPVEYILPFEQMRDSIYAYNKDAYFSPQVVKYETEPAATVSGDYKQTPIKHTVKTGESLNIIARKYHTTAAEIAKNSKIGSAATIHPGQQLIVGYTKTFVPKPKQTEVVQSNIPIAATTKKDTVVMLEKPTPPAETKPTARIVKDTVFTTKVEEMFIVFRDTSFTTKREKVVMTITDRVLPVETEKEKEEAIIEDTVLLAEAEQAEITIEDRALLALIGQEETTTENVALPIETATITEEAVLPIETEQPEPIIENVVLPIETEPITEEAALPIETKSKETITEESALPIETEQTETITKEAALPIETKQTETITENTALPDRTEPVRTAIRLPIEVKQPATTQKDTIFVLGTGRTYPKEDFAKDTKEELMTGSVVYVNGKKYVMYKIEQGDNLFQIATKFKPTTMDEIAKANQLVNGSVLRVGQLIKIPIY